MGSAEQQATAHPERADWHRFTVLGVYADGRGIEPENVGARELQGKIDVIERAGARAVVRYDGYFPKDGTTEQWASAWRGQRYQPATPPLGIASPASLEPAGATIPAPEVPEPHRFELDRIPRLLL